MNRILLAIDDSPAGLAAARTAIGLAVATGGGLRVVHVLSDGSLARALDGSGHEDDVRERQTSGAESVLHHVADLAAAAGVSAETRILQGKPARSILADATAWRADLIVVGRAGGRHVGEHYVGSAVQRVLEFTEIPVLVVPP